MKAQDALGNPTASLGSSCPVSLKKHVENVLPSVGDLAGFPLKSIADSKWPGCGSVRVGLVARALRPQAGHIRLWVAGNYQRHQSLVNTKKIPAAIATGI